MQLAQSLFMEYVEQGVFLQSVYLILVRDFFYGGTSLILPQLIGMFAIGSWAYLTSYAVLNAIDLTLGLSVSKEEEVDGLDVSEYGTTAYGDFNLKNNTTKY